MSIAMSKKIDDLAKRVSELEKELAALKAIKPGRKPKAEQNAEE